MDFKGMFGEPKRLCTDATRRLCDAIEQNGPPTPTRFILMNTVAVQNPDLDEKRTWFERGLLTFLRHTLPPHRDNEAASAHLHRNVGQDFRFSPVDHQDRRFPFSSSHSEISLVLQNYEECAGIRRARSR